MTRARRIHQSEATQSAVGKVELTLTKVKVVNLDTGDEVAVVTGPAQPQEFGPEVKRFCKRCESAAGGVGLIVSRTGKPVSIVSDQPVVVAHTGTAHLDAGEGMTMCGLEEATIR